MVSTLSSMKRTSGSTSGFQTSSSPPGFRNLIINGDMAVAQRGASFAAIADGAFSLDRWKWGNVTSTGVATVTQDTDVPTIVEAGADFKYSLKIDVTTADASVAAGDLILLTQMIEGWNLAPLGFGAANALPFTLSFWVKSPKTGDHTVAIANYANNRNYPATYSVSSANTWEKKTLTIPGDTSGTWYRTNGRGAQIRWTLLAGTTWNGTDDAWQGSNKLAVAGQVNVFDNTANNFYITGVQVEFGSSATDFEFVPWDYQLRRCQRYYWKTFAYATAPGNNVGFLGSLRGRGICVDADEPWVDVRFPVAMRTTPTVTSYNWGTGTAGEWASSGDVADSGARPTNFNDNGGQIDNTDAAAAANDTWNIHAAADAEL